MTYLQARVGPAFWLVELEVGRAPRAVLVSRCAVIRGTSGAYPYVPPGSPVVASSADVFERAWSAGAENRLDRSRDTT